MALRVTVAVVCAAASLAAVSCVPGGGPQVVPAPTAPFPAAAPEDRPFLIDPSIGYPHAIDSARSLRLAEGYEALVGGDPASAGRVARELAGSGEGFPPARVLAAQVDLYRKQAAAALAGTRDIIAELPGYTAAELVYGRSAEAIGEVVEAYEVFVRAAPLSSVAANRADELGERALEIVSSRVEDALARGRLDLAEPDVERLRGWAPEAEATLRAERSLAVAEGDLEAELDVVERLSLRFAEDRALIERRAELELEVGDAGAGLALYEELARANPDDPYLADRVDSGKFRWRFQQLPPRVTRLASEPELSRADFAVLAYWMVPAVRYSRGRSARIASDILDDPRREEITRVLNARVLDVDASVHRFSPDRALRRGEALAGLLKVLSGLGENSAPCASKVSLNPSPSRSFVCSTAASCGLLASSGDCLAEGGVSGGEALELIRRTLARLGS